MAPCRACSKQLLTFFIREATGIDIGSLSASSRVTRQLSNTAFRRDYSSTHPRQHRASTRSQSSFAPITSNSLSDDIYIPFEDISLSELGRDDVQPPLPNPFSPPPPPVLYRQESSELLNEDHSGSEPEIELSGDLTALDFNMAQEHETTTGRFVPATNRDASEPTLENKHHEASKNVDVASTELTAQSGKHVKTEEVPTSSLSKMSRSRQTREERLVKWRDARPPPVIKPVTRKEIIAPQRRKVESTVVRKTILAPSTNTSREPMRQTPKSLGRKLGREPVPLTIATEREQWQIDKAALKIKFRDEAWKPLKKLSPDALEGIRALHSQHPEQFTTPVLADHFKVSPEAIRRILKSKWRASADEDESRRERWDKRGERIWASLVESGVHAPKKWREMGIGGGPRRKAQGKVSIWRSARDAKPGASSESSGSGSAWVDSVAARLS